MRTVPELNVKFDQIHNDVRGTYKLLERSSAKLNARIEVVASELRDRIDGLDRKIDGVAVDLGGRIEGLDTKIGGVADRLDQKVDGVTAELGGRIGRVEAKLEAHDERFDGVESKLDTVIELLGKHKQV